MLNRYWRWTNDPAELPAVTSLPFGPLRYRAWTNGSLDIPPVPPTLPLSGGGARPFVFRVDASYRLLEDDEIMIIVIASAAASGLLN